ncbi:MAG: methionyl-tRNA formyltransferase, partial [Candidatus Firestonebacteria bacterium RIFOXYA2_FULL_40_8]
MKILFYGTADISARVLKKLFDTKKHEIEVVTSCDKPRGRGMTVAACEVKGLADFLDLKSYQPEKIKDELLYETLEKNGYDLGVVVAYGQILSQKIIDLPEKGTINLHFSLLPKYRGAAPYNWALINGEKITGVTIMYVKKELDEGDIISQKEVKIEADDDAGTLLEKLIKEGGELLAKAIDDVAAEKAGRKEQNKAEATYFGKLPEDIGNIDWGKSAKDIHNLVRGLAPLLSAYSLLNGKFIKILKTEPVSFEGKGQNGEIVGTEKGKGLIVKTGDGFLLVESIKPEGKKEMNFEDYARGNRIVPGMKFAR